MTTDVNGIDKSVQHYKYKPHQMRSPVTREDWHSIREAVKSQIDETPEDTLVEMSVICQSIADDLGLEVTATGVRNVLYDGLSRWQYLETYIPRAVIKQIGDEAVKRAQNSCVIRFEYVSILIDLIERYRDTYGKQAHRVKFNESMGDLIFNALRKVGFDFVHESA
jgi:hypothetical protein